MPQPQVPWTAPICPEPGRVAATTHPPTSGRSHWPWRPPPPATAAHVQDKFCRRRRRRKNIVASARPQNPLRPISTPAGTEWPTAHPPMCSRAPTSRHAVTSNGACTCPSCSSPKKLSALFGASPPATVYSCKGTRTSEPPPSSPDLQRPAAYGTESSEECWRRSSSQRSGRFSFESRHRPKSPMQPKWNPWRPQFRQVGPATKEKPG